MFFMHRVLNTVTMMYNEADELTACHFIRPSTYWKRQEAKEVKGEPSVDGTDESEGEKKPLSSDQLSEADNPVENAVSQNEPN